MPFLLLLNVLQINVLTYLELDFCTFRPLLLYAALLMTTRKDTLLFTVIVIPIYNRPDPLFPYQLLFNVSLNTHAMPLLNQRSRLLSHEHAVPIRRTTLADSGPLPPPSTSASSGDCCSPIPALATTPPPSTTSAPGLGLSVAHGLLEWWRRRQQWRSLSTPPPQPLLVRSRGGGVQYTQRQQ